MKDYKKILNRYLFWEILRNSILYICLLVLIFSLFHFLDELGKDYSMNAKIEYILYSMPVTTDMLAGLAIFMASIITIGNLNARRELQIFFVGGVSFLSFIKKVVLISFSLSFLMLILGQIYSPFFSEKSLRVKAEATGQTFNNSDENIWIKKDNLFINIDTSTGGSEFSGISMFETDIENNLIKFSNSEKGYLEKQHLKVIDTSIIHLEKIDKSEFVMQNPSKNRGELLLVDLTRINTLKKDERTMNLLELIEAAIFISSSGLKNEVYIAEIFSRLTRPFITVGLVLISIPIILNLRRNSSLTKMILIGISLALVFNLFSKLMGLYAVSFGLNVFLASLLPLAVTFLISIISLIKFNK